MSTIKINGRRVSEAALEQAVGQKARIALVQEQERRPLVNNLLKGLTACIYQGVFDNWHEWLPIGLLAESHYCELLYQARIEGQRHETAIRRKKKKQERQQRKKSRSKKS